MQAQAADGELAIPISKSLQSVLPSLDTLVSLHLTAGTASLTTELAQALSHLTALQSLRVDAVQPSVAPAVVTAIAPLAALTLLQLACPAMSREQKRAHFDALEYDDGYFSSHKRAKAELSRAVSPLTRLKVRPCVQVSLKSFTCYGP